MFSKIGVCLILSFLLIGCGKTDFSKLQEKGGIYFNEEKPFTGEAVAYSEKNEIEAKGKFIDGKPDDGVIFTYQNSGKLKSKVHYSYGKRNGEGEYYDENEKIKYKVIFENDEEVGETIEYDENGNIKEEKIVNYLDIVKRGELSYLKNEDKPYTGKVMKYFKQKAGVKFGVKDGKEDKNIEVVFYDEEGKILQKMLDDKPIIR